MKKTGSTTTAEKEVIETAVYCDGCGDKIDGEAKERYGETFCESCFEDRFAVCSGCGEVIEREDSYEAGGETYCETCLNNSFFLCPDCEEYEPIDDAVTVHCRNSWRPWRMDEKTVCESCADRKYIKCADCGHYVPEDQSYFTGHDYPICSDCYESNYGTCDNCNEVEHYDNLIYLDRRDETLCVSCYHDCGCGSIQDYSYKPPPKYRHFNQNTNQTVFSRQPGNRLYLGFELEVESRSGSPDSVAGNLIEDYDDGENLFYCKHDGSLDNGFEIVSHPLTLRAHKVQDYSYMLQSLKQAGCRSHDVDTCGLHVHVSRSFFTPSEMVKLGLFVYFNKSRLETFARRTESSYAKFKPVPKHDLQSAGYSENRYEAINFENRSTIEFRLFKGTLNFETFVATLEFCDAVSRFVKTVSACLIAKDGGFDLFKTFLKKDGNRKLYKNLLTYLESKGL